MAAWRIRLTATERTRVQHWIERARLGMLLAAAVIGAAPEPAVGQPCGPTVRGFVIDEPVNVVKADRGRVLLGGAFKGVGPHIAAFDGTTFSPVGTGLGAPAIGVEVLGIARHDDGTGSTIYVTGSLNVVGAGPREYNFARLENGVFRAFGPTDAPFEWMGDVASYDFGTGPRLITTGGGLFPCDYSVEWDGTRWRCTGDGLATVFTDHVEYDDGGGRALFCAGPLAILGVPGQAGFGIARWDGAAWTAVGGGLNGWGEACTVFDDGSGPALYVGGMFNAAGNVMNPGHIARWDGTRWSAVGGGVNGLVTAMEVFDDGSGPKLYVAGSFTSAGGVAVAGVARWDGRRWSPGPARTNGTIRDLEILDMGGGRRSRLCVAGEFTSFGGVPAQNFAVIDPGPRSADVTGDDAVSIDDLLLYLSWFDAGAGVADFDDGRGGGDTDGGVGIEDLLYFLGQYGFGC